MVSQLARAAVSMRRLRQYASKATSRVAPRAARSKSARAVAAVVTATLLSLEVLAYLAVGDKSNERRLESQGM